MTDSLWNALTVFQWLGALGALIGVLWAAMELDSGDEKGNPRDDL
jgi:hypothetical protein